MEIVGRILGRVLGIGASGFGGQLNTRLHPYPLLSHVEDVARP
jgi:hypothetical protein